MTNIQDGNQVNCGKDRPNLDILEAQFSNFSSHALVGPQVLNFKLPQSLTTLSHVADSPIVDEFDMAKDSELMITTPYEETENLVSVLVDYNSEEVVQNMNFCVG